MHNVLLTHIPLSRPHGTDCGPNRERGTIRPGKGFGYENTLSSEISGFLMERVRPVLIFRCVRRNPILRSKAASDARIAAMTTITAKCNTRAVSEKSPSSPSQCPWGSKNPGFSCYPFQRMVGTTPKRSTSCAYCPTNSESISTGISLSSLSRWG